MKEFYKKINIKQVIAIVLSFINLLFSFYALSIIFLYIDILLEGNFWRFEYHDVGIELVMIVYGMIALGNSLITIVKYFRHKKVGLIYPIIFFLLPFFLFVVIPYSLYLLRKIN